MDSIAPLSAPLDLTKPAQMQAGEDSTAAAKRFQSMLASMLVKEMRTTLPEGFFGSGTGNDVYGGWLDEHVGESLARRDALHIEGMLKESIERKARVEGGGS